MSEWTLPKRWKVCDCEQPILRCEDKMESHKITCENCGKFRIIKTIVGAF